MNFSLEDYPLPAEVFEKIIELAEKADALFVGEIHGTREIPQIVAGLLHELYDQGYRGLGVEAPRFEQESLRKWLSDPTSPIPEFYSKPWPDGRGSREMLALIRRAHRLGFQIFCFDPGLIRKNAAWTERDAGMAQNSQETWQNEFPNDKIILMCGSNHAFLKPPPQAGSDYWPLFAEALRRLLPEKQYRAINLMPASGEFYNMGIKHVQAIGFLTSRAESLESPRIHPSEFVSMQVDFPQCHDATFFSPPKTPSPFRLLRVLLAHFGQKIISRRKRNAQNSPQV